MNKTMTRRRIASIAVAALLGGALALGSQTSAGATPLPSNGGASYPTPGEHQAKRPAPPDPVAYTWSDCIYYTPLSNAVVIEEFPHNIVLTCGGVRHIKIEHGFNEDTGPCINNTLGHFIFKETSKTDNNNWLYSALSTVGGNEYMQYYQSFVVVSKSTAQIVTAYTETNTYAGKDSWYTCAREKFGDS